MWEIISVTFDLVLLFGGILAMRYAKMIGGSVGRNSMAYMAFGFFMLAIAHLSETVLIKLSLDVDVVILEVIHRLIVFVAFIMLIISYRRLAKFVSS